MAGAWQLVDVGDRRLRRGVRLARRRLLVVHNLSDAPCRAQLPADWQGGGADGDRVQQDFGDGPALERPSGPVRMAPYGFRWLRLVGLGDYQTAPI